MPEFPEELLKIVKSCSDEHADSVEKAVAAARKRLARRPDFVKWREDFGWQHIKQLMYDQRSSVNAKWRRGTRTPEPSPKRGVTMTGAVAEAAARTFLMDWRIGGTVVGMLNREQLVHEAMAARKEANGKLFNATVLEQLAKHAKDDQPLHETCSDEKAYGIYLNVQKTFESGAA